MTRTVKNIGFTIPPAMAEEFERLAKEERRTKSEMFREMFRLYRTYRKQRTEEEAKRFQQLIDQAIGEAETEKKTKPKAPEDLAKETTRLQVSLEARAKRLGITKEDMDTMVYEGRGKENRGV